MVMVMAERERRETRHDLYDPRPVVVLSAIAVLALLALCYCIIVWTRINFHRLAVPLTQESSFLYLFPGPSLDRPRGQATPMMSSNRGL